MAGEGARPTRFDVRDALSTCQAQELQNSRQLSAISRQPSVKTKSFPNQLKSEVSASRTYLCSAAGLAVHSKPGHNPPREFLRCGRNRAAVVGAGDLP